MVITLKIKRAHSQINRKKINVYVEKWADGTAGDSRGETRAAGARGRELARSPGPRPAATRGPAALLTCRQGPG